MGASPHSGREILWGLAPTRRRQPTSSTSENAVSRTLVHKPRMCFAFVAIYRGSLHFDQRNSAELGYTRRRTRAALGA